MKKNKTFIYVIIDEILRSIVTVHLANEKARFWSPTRTQQGVTVVYFSRQASQLWVYQSHDYHVYIPNTYQTTDIVPDMPC